MNVPAEVDWVAAWYDTWTVIDSTINFWITATFAVIVAVHALGSRASKQVTRPVAALYGCFSLFTASRMVVIFLESGAIMSELNALGIIFVNDHSWGYSFWSGFSGLVMMVTFVSGTAYTLYFVLTAPRRHGA